MQSLCQQLVTASCSGLPRLPSTAVNCSSRLRDMQFSCSNCCGNLSHAANAGVSTHNTQGKIKNTHGRSHP